MRNWSRSYLILFITILFLAFGLRQIGLTKGMWLDEYAALQIARSSSFLQSLRLNDYPPTYFLVLRVWAGISSSEPFLREFSVLLGVATIAVVMRWVRQYSTTASLLAGFLLATAPFVIRYAQEIQAYALLLFAGACALYCTGRIIAGGRRIWYLLLAISLCIMITSQLTGIFMTVAIAVYLLSSPIAKKDRQAWLWNSLTIVTAVVVFILTYFIFTQGGKSGNWWMPPLTTKILREQYQALFGWAYLLAPRDWISLLSWSLVPVYGWGLMTVLVFCAAALLIYGDWRKSWVLLTITLVFWLQIILFSILILPILYNRILLLGLVPLAAFIGVQTATIKRSRLRISIMTGLILVSGISTIAWIKMSANVPPEEWRQAGSSLQSEYRPGDLVVFYPDYITGIARYYSPLIQDSDVLSLPLGPNLAALKSELARRQSEPLAGPFMVFLVVRPGNLVTQDIATYQNLLSYLKNSASQVSPPVEYKGLYIQPFFIR